MPDSPAILNKMSKANFSSSEDGLPTFARYGVKFSFSGRNGPGVHYQYNKQVHGTVVTKAQRTQENATLQADGIWTKERGFIVAVRTADCLPILFTDKHSSIAMAVHAGWRGLTAGIILEAVKIICAEGIKVEDIIVAIGPAISRERYEVGPEVVTALFQGGTGLNEFCASICIAKGVGDRWFLDLQAAALLNLLELRIPADQIDLLNICTFGSDQFFSFRREGKGVGSNISWISL